jgi:hypothetical protein
VTPTKRQIEILKHALGIHTYRCKAYRDGAGYGDVHRERFRAPYRNHYYPGGDAVEVCASLVALGLMRSPDGAIFHVTIEGERVVFTHLAALGVTFKRKWGYYR